MSGTTIIERKTSTDFNTGEVLEDKEKVYKSDKLPDEPDYIKFYINAWCNFKNIKGINNNFLYELIKYMSYAEDEQLVILNSSVKRKIAEKLNWSKKSALDRCNQELKKLLKYNIIKSYSRGIYQVNPQLVGKGNWKDIYKLQATFNIIGDNAGKVDVSINKQ